MAEEVHLYQDDNIETRDLGTLGLYEARHEPYSVVVTEGNKTKVAVRFVRELNSTRS